MRDVRAINLTAVSGRELCYVSENEGIRFLGPPRPRDKSGITWPLSHRTQGRNTASRKGTPSLR